MEINLILYNTLTMVDNCFNNVNNIIMLKNTYAKDKTLYLRVLTNLALLINEMQKVWFYYYCVFFKVIREKIGQVDIYR